MCISLINSQISKQFSSSSVYIIFNLKKMDSQNQNQAAFNAGQAQGQTQEKANTMMDKATNTAQAAKESAQEAGQQMMAKAQGAVDTIKDATGMNKSN
ncbi:hypothetical protein L6164_006580 [Bauhinia variegata]|uniref:Uncharacterized protein n=1 Tax=Bauhinia variegata TaxID=167791 RepID=A0ACB9PUW5_BAUVA|nr:hypothetical protein L6164_006580 [Bauhinia variegata]